MNVVIKKGTWLLVALLAACSITAVLMNPARAEALEFNDVVASTPHKDDIEWLALEGISTGFDDKTFRPYADVARCDMAAFLYRLVGEPYYQVSDEDLSKFSDVDKRTPHYKEICWLAAEGISEGFLAPNGSRYFSPYASIARCDMAAFLQRIGDLLYAEVSGSGRSFSDVSSSTSHSSSIAWLAKAKVTTGFEDGTFRPYETIKRCDMAAFLHRTDGILPAGGFYNAILGKHVGVFEKVQGINMDDRHCLGGRVNPFAINIKSYNPVGNSITADLTFTVHNHMDPINTVEGCEGDSVYTAKDVIIVLDKYGRDQTVYKKEDVNGAADIEVRLQISRDLSTARVIVEDSWFPHDGTYDWDTFADFYNIDLRSRS